MEQITNITDESCKADHMRISEYRKELPGVIDTIIDSMNDEECFAHIGDDPLNFGHSVTDMIDHFREIIFPGYFSKEKIDGANLQYTTGRTLSKLYEILSEQIMHVLRHDCLRYGQKCIECEQKGYDIALSAIRQIPQLRKQIAEDVKGAYDGDPAAKSHDEIIFSYPGLYAICVYRIAHILYTHGVPQLPRIMTEHAHSVTGIDIHPGAIIGARFVIDHGTGIVIGETTRIGNNVRIYQNVTLGALSLPPGAGPKLREAKRHPTIEDNVIIYSGATILGGETVIGKDTIIGGNVWLTESVPQETKVFIEPPRLIYKNHENGRKTTEEQHAEHTH